MIENEFKIMLDLEQYEKLLALYEWDETVVQTNYYYDSADLALSKLHITCRVREINGRFFLQTKFPAANKYSRVELEKPLDALPETIDELPRPQGLSALPTVKRLGKLVTKRSVKRFNGGEIDLDRSGYFGKTDYEVEIEFTDEQNARKILAELAEKLDIKPSSEVCTGKVRRFLDEYSRNANKG